MTALAVLGCEPTDGNDGQPTTPTSSATPPASSSATGGYKYWPAASGGACVCSTDLDTEGVHPGKMASLSATYAKLPASLDQVDIYVPGAGLVEKVVLEMTAHDGTPTCHPVGLERFRW